MVLEPLCILFQHTEPSFPYLNDIIIQRKNFERFHRPVWLSLDLHKRKPDLIAFFSLSTLV